MDIAYLSKRYLKLRVPQLLQGIRTNINLDTLPVSLKNALNQESLAMSIEVALEAYTEAILKLEVFNPLGLVDYVYTEDEIHSLFLVVFGLFNKFPFPEPFARDIVIGTNLEAPVKYKKGSLAFGYLFPDLIVFGWKNDVKYVPLLVVEMKRNIHQPSFEKAEAQIATYLTLLRNNYSCKKIYGMLLDLHNYIVYSYDTQRLEKSQERTVGLFDEGTDNFANFIMLVPSLIYTSYIENVLQS